MTIADKAVPVTRANRGIWQALVDEALARGATRVYAGTRPLPPARVRPERARQNAEDAMVIQHQHQPAGQLRSRPLPGLRPRDRPAGPLLAGAARGAGLQGGPPMGPPAHQLGAVVLRHR